MSNVVILKVFSNSKLAEHLVRTLQLDFLEYDLRRFPDGETYFNLESDVKGKKVILFSELSFPDEKFLSLVFIANTLRELGAVSVGLLIPYLPYMRQDIRFHPGEAVTSRIFARLISSEFDWLLTVDPHLHRYKQLNEIYSIPTKVLSAVQPIAVWVKENVTRPVLIGPDAESEQWVSKVAECESLPYVVLTKTRKGDFDVEVSKPQLAEFQAYTPVLVDDIVSTGRTMIETIHQLSELGMRPAVCIGVHAVFAGTAYDDLLHAGVEAVVTCNSLAHQSNQIDLLDIFEPALEELLR